MSEAARETSCDWTVTGMDCGSCATKIKDAVTRLPGVSGVEVGIMSERLRLTLDEGQTGRDKIEKTVRALGYEIAPRAAGAKKDFVLPGAQSAPEQSDMHQDHDHSAHAPAGHDHSGHDQGPKAASTKRDDSGHGSPGHVHDDPADRGKRWYQTAKGKLVIFTEHRDTLNYLSTEVHKRIFANVFSQTAAEPTKAAARALMEPTLDYLAKKLGDRDTLVGTSFTVADAYLVTLLNWFGFVGVDLKKWPTIDTYYQKHLQRPSVAHAMGIEMAERKRRAA